MRCKAAAQRPRTPSGNQATQPALCSPGAAARLVKGILESTVYIGKTLLLRPADAKLAADRAADEPYPRRWALRCLVGTFLAFPVQDLPQCSKDSSSTR